MAASYLLKIGGFYFRPRKRPQPAHTGPQILGVSIPRRQESAVDKAPAI
jgi:hypothetical protein